MAPSLIPGAGSSADGDGASRDDTALFFDLYENAPAALFSVGPEGLIHRCNRQAGSLLGCPHESLLGRPILDLYADSGNGKAKAREIFQRFREGGSVQDEELEMCRADGMPVWISLTVNARRDDAGAVLESRSMVVDISGRKQAEAHALQLNRLYRTLSEVNQAIVRAADRKVLLENTCRALVEHGGFRMAWAGFKDEGTGRVVPEGSAGFEAGYLEGIVIRWDDSPEGMGPTGQAIREKRGIGCDDCLTDPAFAPWRESARSRGYRTSCAFPIFRGDQVTGALMVYHAEAGAIGVEESRLLEELAADLGFALEAMETKENLRQAEKIRGEILDRISDAFVALDKDWRYTFLNEQAAALFGRTPGDLIGKHIWTEFPEGVGQPFHEAYEKAMREQVPVFFEDHYAPWDRWFENRVFPSQEGLSIFFHEITERKRAELALKESERRLRATLENVELLAVTLDAEGAIAFCNDFMLRLTGWRREEAQGKPWFDVFLPPEVRGEVQAVFTTALMAGEIPLHYENEILTRAGERRLIRWNNTLLRDAHGVITGTVSLGEDITDSKRAERTLSGQKQVLELIATGSPLADTLTALVRLIEGQSPGMLGSILLLDEDGVHVRHGAAPSLPDAFVRAVDGQPIGPCAGSCGTAAYRKEAVHVEDIATDPLWEAYKGAALPHGLRACWSTPIFDAERRVLGTFAMYYRQPALPQPEHLRLIDIATQSAAIAIGHHRTEKALRQSEEYHRFLFDHSPIGLALCRMDGAMVYVNQAYCRIFGRTPEETLGLSYWDVTPARYAEKEQEQLRHLRETGHYGPYEKEYLHRDGHPVPVSLTGLLVERQGEEFIWSSVEDITERKRAEEALAQRVAQLAALNTLSINLSSTLDLQGRGRAALEGILKATSPDLALIFLREGDDLRLLESVSGEGRLHHDETPNHRVGHCLCGLAVKEGRALFSLNIQADLRCTWDECKKAGVKSFAVLPLNYGQEIIGVLGLASAVERDYQQQSAFLETLAAQVATGLQNALLHEKLKTHATDLERRVAERTALLREANEDLALAVEHAQTADRAKSAFLSAMSHELRTPLNSVIGFTGVLLGGLAGELKPEQREPLIIVQRNGRHLLALINDVLDLSRIEAGEMRLGPGPFDLVETSREALESMGPSAAAKHLALEADFRVSSLPTPGDRRRVAQILLNLLSNAVKFTEAGTVMLKVYEEGGWAKVAVQDTGPGIPETDLPRLFREFEQLEGGLARRSEGTGLGLALSRRLARLMNGDIVVESRPSVGSTFTLLLPLGEP